MNLTTDKENNQLNLLVLHKLAVFNKGKNYKQKKDFLLVKIVKLKTGKILYLQQKDFVNSICLCYSYLFV